MKARKKPGKNTSNKKLKIPQEKPPLNEQEEEERRDFMGLPVRDLKKNLGCG